MRITLMHNPTAGRGELSREQLQEMLQKAGYDPRYQSTQRENFPQALKTPGELVVVAGGDGTVGKVFPHLMGREIPLTILPIGTANNIAKTLGILGKPEKLIEGWKSARRRTVDVGIAKGPWGTIPFIEAVGVGFFPQMMSFISAINKAYQLPSRDEELKYDLNLYKALLPYYRSQEWSINLDGQTFSGRYLLVEVMNIAHLGPKICLGSQADPSDGYLDLVLVKEEERESMVQYLADCWANKSVSPNFAVHQGQRLQIQWDGSEIHIDSKLWGIKSFFQKVNLLKLAAPSEIEISLKRHLLQFLVP